MVRRKSGKVFVSDATAKEMAEWEKPVRARMYHSLLSLRDGKWVIDFGDYDEEVVKQEARDTKERGIKQRIITTLPHQKFINDAVAKLNS
jgi:hypothetical protein